MDRKRDFSLFRSNVLSMLLGRERLCAAASEPANASGQTKLNRVNDSAFARTIGALDNKG
jgi:hypothetical protein